MDAEDVKGAPINRTGDLDHTYVNRTIQVYPNSTSITYTN